MKIIVVPISKGGQISIPAEIRRRWEVDRVVIDDAGDHLIIEPLPADPIAAVAGGLITTSGQTWEGYKRAAREEDARLDNEQAGRHPARRSRGS